MRTAWIRSTAASIVLLVASAAPDGQASQGWPVKPVRIVVTGAPGGSSDLMARLIGQELAEALGQPVVVDNKPGAGGTIATEFAARAAPDGYTLFASHPGVLAISPVLTRVSYDPIGDFRHIAILGGPPNALCVHPSSGITDLSGLAALGRNRPLTYGTAGIGTTSHLIGERISGAAGIDMRHVPYSGGSRAATDLVANHIPVAILSLSTAAPLIRSGQIRAIAVSASKRLPEFAAVPTFAEQGHPDLIETTWYGLSGPAGLSDEIVLRINREARKAMRAERLRQHVRAEGIETQDMDVADSNAFVRSEIIRLGAIIRAAGLAGR